MLMKKALPSTWKTNLTRNYSSRVKGVKGPENLDADIIGLRSLVPSSYMSTPRAFLFADLNPYTDGYDFAYKINLDWGLGFLCIALPV